MKEAINFLRTVYKDSVPDVARILVAEAEGDATIISRYLDTVSKYVEKLKSKVETYGKENR